MARTEAMSRLRDHLNLSSTAIDLDANNERLIKVLQHVLLGMN